MRLLVGTNNSHKAGEIAAMLAASGIEVVTPRDLGIDDEAPEDADTFEANALSKARFYAKRSGVACLADDSGLVVDALGGRPGVFSSRYAPSDPERIARLLGEMDGVDEMERSARFVCAAAFVSAGGQALEVGVCEGRIALKASGTNGFGYDPIFYLPALGRTMAELAPGEKNALSHRGKALRAICPRVIETLAAST